MPLVASVTFTVKLNVPMVVGIPEIVPFGAKVNPDGKTPDMFVQVYGVCPPEAVNVWS